jgi:hypothetical protein
MIQLKATPITNPVSLLFLGYFQQLVLFGHVDLVCVYLDRYERNTSELEA